MQFVLFINNCSVSKGLYQIMWAYILFLKLLLWPFVDNFRYSPFVSGCVHEMCCNLSSSTRNVWPFVEKCTGVCKGRLNALCGGFPCTGLSYLDTSTLLSVSRGLIVNWSWHVYGCVLKRTFAVLYTCNTLRLHLYKSKCVWYISPSPKCDICVIPTLSFCSFVTWSLL